MLACVCVPAHICMHVYVCVSVSVCVCIVSVTVKHSVLLPNIEDGVLYNSSLLVFFKLFFKIIFIS